MSSTKNSHGHSKNLKRKRSFDETEDNSESSMQPAPRRHKKTEESTGEDKKIVPDKESTNRRASEGTSRNRPINFGVFSVIRKILDENRKNLSSAAPRLSKERSDNNESSRGSSSRGSYSPSKSRRLHGTSIGEIGDPDVHRRSSFSRKGSRTDASVTPKPRETKSLEAKEKSCDTSPVSSRTSLSKIKAPLKKDERYSESRTVVSQAESSKDRYSKTPSKSSSKRDNLSEVREWHDERRRRISPIRQHSSDKSRKDYHSKHSSQDSTSGKNRHSPPKYKRSHIQRKRDEDLSGYKQQHSSGKESKASDSNFSSKPGLMDYSDSSEEDWYAPGEGSGAPPVWDNFAAKKTDSSDESIASDWDNSPVVRKRHNEKKCSRISSSCHSTNSRKEEEPTRCSSQDSTSRGNLHSLLKSKTLYHHRDKKEEDVCESKKPSSGMGFKGLNSNVETDEFYSLAHLDNPYAGCETPFVRVYSSSSEESVEEVITVRNKPLFPREFTSQTTSDTAVTLTVQKTERTDSSPPPVFKTVESQLQAWEHRTFLQEMNICFLTQVNSASKKTESSDESIASDWDNSLEVRKKCEEKNCLRISSSSRPSTNSRSKEEYTKCSSQDSTFKRNLHSPSKSKRLNGPKDKEDDSSSWKSESSDESASDSDEPVTSKNERDQKKFSTPKTFDEYPTWVAEKMTSGKKSENVISSHPKGRDPIKAYSKVVNYKTRYLSPLNAKGSFSTPRREINSPRITRIPSSTPRKGGKEADYQLATPWIADFLSPKEGSSETPKARPRITSAKVSKGPILASYQLLGDSLLVRFADQMLNLKAVIGDRGKYCIGLCVSGQTIDGLIEKVLNSNQPLEPKVIVLIGTNDFLKGSRLNEVKTSMMKLLYILKERVSEMVLLTVPPIPRLQTQTFWDDWEKYNRWIKELDNGTTITVLDTAKIYLRSSREADISCYERFMGYGRKRRPDLIHLNRTGLRKLYQEINGHINKLKGCSK